METLAKVKLVLMKLERILVKRWHYLKTYMFVAEVQPRVNFAVFPCHQWISDEERSGIFKLKYFKLNVQLLSRRRQVE